MKTPAEIAETGFGELADRATVLRDELRAAAAPQEMISRLDRILFAASVGQSLARESTVNGTEQSLFL